MTGAYPFHHHVHSSHEKADSEETLCDSEMPMKGGAPTLPPTTYIQMYYGWRFSGASGHGEAPKSISQSQFLVSAYLLHLPLVPARPMLYSMIHDV